ncbi:MAG: ABC transporter substrate-binding protein [Jhaorihella sp.]
MTRIDRRALFTSGAAAALLAATGVSLEASPRPGGRLRLAVPKGDGSLEAVMRGAVFDTLTEIAPDGVLRGELAARWSGSADARDWVFDLREGVRFHDGREMDATDVAASLAARDLPVPGGMELVADAPLRLRIRLRKGNPDLPYLLAGPGMMVTRGGDDGQAMGTGAYRVAQYREDRQFLGHRVETHYRAGRAGWADSVEAVAIPDAAVRAEALRDGFVDVAVLPLRAGLIGQGDFIYHPSAKDMALAARRGVGVPRVVGARGRLDDGRIAERWWIASA